MFTIRLDNDICSLLMSPSTSYNKADSPFKNVTHIKYTISQSKIDSVIVSTDVICNCLISEYSNQKHQKYRVYTIYYIPYSAQNIPMKNNIQFTTPIHHSRIITQSNKYAIHICDHRIFQSKTSEVSKSHFLSFRSSLNIDISV